MINKIINYFLIAFFFFGCAVYWKSWAVNNFRTEMFRNIVEANQKDAYLERERMGLCRFETFEKYTPREMIFSLKTAENFYTDREKAFMKGELLENICNEN